jgi:hypothetical protein
MNLATVESVQIEGIWVGAVPPTTMQLGSFKLAWGGVTWSALTK